MNEYSKKIFSDPVLLRQKVMIFLGQSTKEKSEFYALAFEKFFKNGNQENLKISIVWSWWGFFGVFFFLWYRKIYSRGILWLLFFVFLPVISNIAVGAFGMYFLAKRFEELLDKNDDEILKNKGGANKWVPWVFGVCLISGALIYGFLFFAKVLPNFMKVQSEQKAMKARLEFAKMIDEISVFYKNNGILANPEDMTQIKLENFGENYAFVIENEKCLVVEFNNTNISFFVPENIKQSSCGAFLNGTNIKNFIENGLDFNSSSNLNEI